jgi:hypothetical protein
MIQYWQKVIYFTLSQTKKHARASADMFFIDVFKALLRMLENTENWLFVLILCHKF